MVHSLKAMSTKIAPGNTLRTLTTGKYRIHALFTASNLWIVIFSDLTHHELHERLDKIYELYLKYVVHNMLKPIDLRAVSYTHLDVYKRQSQKCSPMTK